MSRKEINKLLRSFRTIIRKNKKNYGHLSKDSWSRKENIWLEIREVEGIYDLLTKKRDEL